VITAAPALATDETGTSRRSAEVTAPAQYVGLAESDALSPGEGETLLTATCSDCHAWSWAGWTGGGASFAGETRNYASEVIDTQEVHIVLVHGSSCWDPDGTYLGQQGTGNVYNVEDSALLYTGYQSAGSGNVWTNANGHNWWNDGQHWAVNGDADICKTF